MSTLFYFSKSKNNFKIYVSQFFWFLINILVICFTQILAFKRNQASVISSFFTGFFRRLVAIHKNGNNNKCSAHNKLNRKLKSKKQHRNKTCYNYSQRAGKSFENFICIFENNTQCARTDLNKRFLPKPMTTTGWKGTP